MVKQDLDFSVELRVWEGLIGDACLSVAWWRFGNQLVGVCNERSGASGELGCANEGSRPTPSHQDMCSRPRFGAGPKTAGLTGFTYWIMGCAAYSRPDSSGIVPEATVGLWPALSALGFTGNDPAPPALSSSRCAHLSLFCRRARFAFVPLRPVVLDLGV